MWFLRGYLVVVFSILYWMWYTAEFYPPHDRHVIVFGAGICLSIWALAERVALLDSDDNK
jgi:hypothetical protein